jgi:peptidoglycan/LPS O-acetylase OafA/YrhL
MVVLSHAGPSLAAANVLRLKGDFGVIFYFLGSLGVTLFFGLSGYLITHLLVREQLATNRISLRKFYMRRFLRIIPAVYLYLGAIIACSWIGILAVTWRDILTAGTFLKNYFPFDTSPFKPGWYVGHTWSLAVEEQFYLFWPLVMVSAGLRRARAVALWLILLMPLIRFTLYYLFPDSRPGLGLGTQIHNCADLMMYGSLFALLDGDPRFERVMANARPWVYPGILLGFSVIVSPLLRDRFHGAYYLTLGISIESFAFAFMIAWLLRNADSWPARLLNLRPIAFVGTLSYSLYLWQQPFLAPSNATVSGRFPLNILFAFLAALGSYFIVERPFLRLRRRFRAV